MTSSYVIELEDKVIALEKDIDAMASALQRTFDFADKQSTSTCDCLGTLGVNSHSLVIALNELQNMINKVRSL